MTSPFDVLLDFGDISPAKKEGAFDPLGPSDSRNMKGREGDDSMLDLEYDAQISPHQNGTYLKAEFSVDNTNPLYEFTSGNTNMSGSDAFNPLYEQDKSVSSNPLYDFLSSENANGHDDDFVKIGGNLDLLGTGTTTVSDDSGVTMETSGAVEDDSLVSFDTKENLRNEYIEEQTQRGNEEEEEEEEDDDEEEEEVDVEDQQWETNGLDQEEEGEQEEDRSEEVEFAEELALEDSGSHAQHNVQQNGYTEDEEPPRDPDVFRETRDKDEIHFAEMGSVRQRFESGKSDSSGAPKRKSIQEEYAETEGGEYENEPVRDSFAVRESDTDTSAELPESGKTKSLLEKFKQIQSTDTTQTGRKPSPPKETGPVEYISEPRAQIDKYEGKSEEGIFESQPQSHEGIIRSGEKLQEDPVPEKGYAKNIVNRYREMDGKKTDVVTKEKKELTPDPSGKVEYVSEPRTKFDAYEGKPESGVFESKPHEDEDVVKSGETVEDIFPEKGAAKNILSKFKEIENEGKNKPPPSPTKRLTPDRSGKVEYVSEPRTVLEKYEPKIDAGVFENKPSAPVEVVRSEDQVEDILPEKGYAKNVKEKFLEIQRSSVSPTTPAKTKEFTPPRESSPGKTVSGVIENTPTQSNLPKYSEVQELELPQKGMAKNVASKFKQMESQFPSSQPRTKKDFTPPKEAGVYESTPVKSLMVEEQKPESGILESKPQEKRPDIIREADAVESDLPEPGLTKNLTSKWKQLESESTSSKGTKSVSPKCKEFTPPREDARVAEMRGLLSPKSPKGESGHVKPQDLPGQYQEQTQPVLYENEPEHNDNIAREDKTDWTEGMPAKDSTKTLLNKFKSIQEQAKESEETPKPVSKKEEVLSDKNSGDKGLKIAVQTEKCAACQKTVYAMEKMEMDKNVYHKSCFKCSHCSARLTPKTFSINEGVMYCTNHFTQLFRRKGNYDEGFGRQPYKKKWSSDSALVDEHEAEKASA